MPLASDASTSLEVGGAAPSLAVDGIFSGLIGGMTVALFYFVIDWLAGRPFFTPSLLGSVMFQGLPAEQVIEVDLVMALAYSGLHMALFVVAGMAAAFTVAQFERHPSLGVVLLILFACLEAGFYTFATALAPGVFAALGAWTVAVANLLAAGVMAIYFWRTHPAAVSGLRHFWEGRT